MRFFKSLKKYFENQIQEISTDRVLRIYGCFVSLIVTLTFAHWLVFRLQNWLVSEEPICWPMFDHCRTFQILSALQLKIVFYIMVGASIATAWLFLRSKWTRVAWISLLALNIIKNLFILMDYRMRLNQHIMAFWITVAFLFLPDKKRTLKILIVFLYFWAGVIKIDPEWLSGSALYIKPWFMDGALLPWACAYVVILEAILIWSLLWDNRWFAWITFGQLIVFHIFSFKIVGFFYPMIMFLIISIFVISWILEPKQTPVMSQIGRTKKIPYALASFALIFSFFQVLPKFYRSDTAVTGEGRLFALHMFDAFTSCEAKANIRLAPGRTLHQNLYLPLAPRIRCDPVVYLSRARAICYKNRSNKRFEDIDVSLKTKRSTDQDYHQVIEIHDFCKRDIHYSLFSRNNWILDPDSIHQM